MCAGEDTGKRCYQSKPNPAKEENEKNALRNGHMRERVRRNADAWRNLPLIFDIHIFEFPFLKAIVPSVFPCRCTCLRMFFEAVCCTKEKKSTNFL